jgi:hypothetical protein
MKYTILIGEHCFGPIVRINDSNLMQETYDEIKLNQNIFELIFNWLKQSINKFSKEELEHLTDILHYRGNKLFSLSEEEFEALDEDESYGKFLCQKFNYNTDVILQELNNSKEELDSMDWLYIVEYIMMYHNSLLIESNFESCDQCGNPNYSSTYILEINE